MLPKKYFFQTNTFSYTNYEFMCFCSRVFHFVYWFFLSFMPISLTGPCSVSGLFIYWSFLWFIAISFTGPCSAQALSLLKVQCHEIFYLYIFFAQKNCPVPHMHRLKRFADTQLQPQVSSRVKFSKHMNIYWTCKHTQVLFSTDCSF